MDELKLVKWRKNFTEEAEKLQPEFDLSFKDRIITDAFVLKVDEVSQTLCLQIINKDLPPELTERLNNLLITTMPEDSI